MMADVSLAQAGAGPAAANREQRGRQGSTAAVQHTGRTVALTGAASGVNLSTARVSSPCAQWRGGGRV